MNENYLKVITTVIQKGHWLTDNVSAELKEYEISEPQFNVLRILRGAKGEPLTVQEISNRMLKRSSNITRLIDKLLKRNLVVRKECETNRRKMDIIITSEGLQLLKKLDKKLEHFHKQFETDLSDRDLKKLSGLLDRIFCEMDTKK